MSRRQTGSSRLVILLMILLLVLSPAFLSAPRCCAADQTVTADVNGDGQVTLDDMAWVLDLIVAEGYDPKADLNGDGKVDLKDLDLVDAAYRKSSAAGGN
jgi:hypothetical protein